MYPSECIEKYGNARAMIRNIVTSRDFWEIRRTAEWIESAVPTIIRSCGEAFVEANILKPIRTVDAKPIWDRMSPEFRKKYLQKYRGREIYLPTVGIVVGGVPAEKWLEPEEAIGRFENDQPVYLKSIMPGVHLLPGVRYIPGDWGLFDHIGVLLPLCGLMAQP